MKNYEDMSDGELSFQVHLVWNNIPEGYATISTFDINNPSDIMPIVFEHNITIELSPDCTFEAYSTLNAIRYGVQFSEKARALRAAAICFLKMKESQNEK